MTETIQQQLTKLPTTPGIYKFYGSTNEVLYVGKAINLTKRVKSYFQKDHGDSKITNLVEKIVRLETISVDSELEALLLESQLIKLYKPRYNSIWKDDKHYIYILITKEKFPKVLFSRKKDDSLGDFFGPFPSSTTAKQIVQLLRRVFPFCTQKGLGKRACFYTHLGLCNPCPSHIVTLNGKEYKSQKAKYRKNITLLKLTLQGKLQRVHQSLLLQMRAFSALQDYEGAALMRDKIQQLDYICHHYHQPESYLLDTQALHTIRAKEMEDLKNQLAPYYKDIALPTTIECYDISNISGKFAAGSLVRFWEGEPQKSHYKRFKIKMKSTPDDFAMLREVFSRRLSHTNWEYPELFIVDGGIGQLSAVGRVFKEKNISVPLIGLAKREEQIIVPYNTEYATISLPLGSPALSLMQRLRDEAHRFAHRYHEFLRLKYLLGGLPNDHKK